jgi:hypothetical protein
MQEVSEDMGTEIEMDDRLDRVTNTIDELLAFMATAVDRPAPEGASWGPREVLAHLVYWLDFSCQGFEEALEGRATPYPNEDLDDLNNRVVKMLADRPMEDMCADLRKLRDRLAAVVKNLRRPDATVLVKKDGTRVKALDRLEMMDQHYRGHLADLKANGVNE